MHWRSLKHLKTKPSYQTYRRCIYKIRKWEIWPRLLLWVSIAHASLSPLRLLLWWLLLLVFRLYWQRRIVAGVWSKRSQNTDGNAAVPDGSTLARPRIKYNSPCIPIGLCMSSTCRYLSVSLSVCLFVFLRLCLSVRLCAYLYVCLTIPSSLPQHIHAVVHPASWWAILSSSSLVIPSQQ